MTEADSDMAMATGELLGEALGTLVATRPRQASRQAALSFAGIG